MANKKISELPGGGDPDDSELYEAVQGGINVKLTGTQKSNYGGEWSWPSGSFPTAARRGILYIAAGDHGTIGDPDYVPSGTWFVSNVAGASTYADFRFNI